MWQVILCVEDEEYVYGTYNDRNKANEIAIQVRDIKNINVVIKDVKIIEII